ncbi:hypothetical protein, partial [uncultured Ruegeria sp.]|uniref:hypothetical protein n=1 Tax=uncultured Ruegeria sp. TaxID=259304 RepID=UPI00261100A7
DRKGARALFRTTLSAPATRCFSTESAHKRRSPTARFAAAAARIAAVRRSRKIQDGSKLQIADKTDLGFSILTDAAPFRSCGVEFLAVQRISCFRSFKGSEFSGTQTELSPGSRRATKTRD